MQNDLKYGLSFALCGIALICFAIGSFLGLNYWTEGNLIIPIATTIIGCYTVCRCIVIACQSKSMRNKRMGLIREFTSCSIILLFLLAGSLPFTKFLQILDKEERLKTEVKQTVNSISQIDSLYLAYAQQRVENYRMHLNSLSTKSKEYQEEIGGVSKTYGKGDIKGVQIKNATASLKRRLIPEQTDTIISRRQEWLKSIGNVNVWNYATPKNIKVISSAGSKWTNDYKTVSQIIYKGENAQPFSYPELNENLETFRADFTQFHAPDFRCILITLCCFALILLPYLITRRKKNRADGTHE